MNALIREALERYELAWQIDAKMKLDHERRRAQRCMVGMGLVIVAQSAVIVWLAVPR